MNTILITGCSSGFGLETARYFLDRDWKVIATMRTPRDGILSPSAHLRILPLDVTDAESISRAMDMAGLRIPTHRGQAFRFDRGHHSDLKPATIPT